MSHKDSGLAGGKTKTLLVSIADDRWKQPVAV